MQSAAADCKSARRCDGCRHNLYSAPGGQAWKASPHSRCLHFRRDIPMLLDVSGRWYASQIPRGCPTFAQEKLPL